MSPRNMLLPAALVWAVVLPTAPVCGQQPKTDDLPARVEELARRVAELEKIVKQMPARAPGKTTTEGKLVGNWVAAGDDRNVEGVITDLKLKSDGTGKAVIRHQDPQWNNMKYDLVGKQLQLREERGGLSYSAAVLVRSVSDTELVLEYKLGETTRQVRYSRDP